jgi:peptide/nickel transport system substrate-binding protein
MGVEVPDYEIWNLQYATLTDKAAADFATAPGLAESWEMSNGGKTYTYTLRDGLTWSDGTPLTAEDVAYTVNRARDEEWQNYTSTVANLTAKVIDPQTVEITSSVKDPKLPTMDVYILPKHVWEKQDKAAITKYEGTDGVGSGPFTLVEAKRGQFMRLQANDGYWGGRPAIDEVVFRLFTNRDAMVAAPRRRDRRGPRHSHRVVRTALDDRGIVAIQGEQGASTRSRSTAAAENQRWRGSGTPPGAFRHRVPEGDRPRDRQADAHRTGQCGIGRPGTTVSPSPNPEWIPEIPEADQFLFDLDKAGRSSSGRVRGHERQRHLARCRAVATTSRRLRRALLSRNPHRRRRVRQRLARTGRHRHQLRTVNDATLTEIIGKGDYDLFEWGWTPFVDPDPELSYFTCGQLSQDPEDPTNYYNDASWCDPSYDADYKAQNQELDHTKRVEIVHRMLRTMYDAAVYNVLLYEPDLQAYRTDRFEGWLRQPAEIGPVLFSNTSPTYAKLVPTASSGAAADSAPGPSWRSPSSARPPSVS